MKTTHKQNPMAAALPPLLASLLRPSDLEAMRQRLAELPEPFRRLRLTREDVLGAVSVFVRHRDRHALPDGIFARTVLRAWLAEEGFGDGGDWGRLGCRHDGPRGLRLQRACHLYAFLAACGGGVRIWPTAEAVGCILSPLRGLRPFAQNVYTCQCVA